MPKTSAATLSATEFALDLGDEYADEYVSADCRRVDSVSCANPASHMQADSYDEGCDPFDDQDLMAVTDSSVP